MMRVSTHVVSIHGVINSFAPDPDRQIRSNYRRWYLLVVALRRIRSIRSVQPMLLIRKDGNELYIESTASPIRGGSRPSVAIEQLDRTAQGQVRCQLKTPYRDGTTHIMLKPMHFMA